MSDILDLIDGAIEDYASPDAMRSVLVRWAGVRDGSAQARRTT